MQGTARKARIFIVDDHPIVRQGLAQLIDQEPDLVVCGEAGDAPTALRQMGTEEPDLAIVDLSLPSCDGIELIKSLRSQCPRVRVLVLSMHDEALYLERALRAGADGFLTKQEAAAEVLAALRQLLRGEMYLSPALAPKLVRLIRDATQGEKAGVDRLSDREFQVFRMIGEGKATKEIADQLCLSVKTIETYRASIKKKLDLPDGQQLVQHAMRWVLSRDKP